jgi:hypothetical protein
MTIEELLASGHLRRTARGICVDLRLRVYAGGQCTVDLRRSERPIREIPSMFNNRDEALEHLSKLLEILRQALER